MNQPRAASAMTMRGTPTPRPMLAPVVRPPGERGGVVVIVVGDGSVASNDFDDAVVLADR